MTITSDATVTTGTLRPPSKEALTLDTTLGVYLTGLLYETAADQITTTGTNQASAYPLTAEISRLTTVAAGTGVVLPPSVPGLDVYLINHGGNIVQVYGSGTDTIDDIASSTGVPQMVQSNVLYSCTTAGAWYSQGIGTGYFGGFPTVSFINNLTAKAGGGQSAATPLTTVINRITTVATAGDSVTLPVATGGLQVTITNAAATNSMNVFPNTGDQINNGGANIAFALAAGKTATFNSAGPTFWHGVLSA